MGDLIFIAVLLSIGILLRRINMGDGFDKSLNDFIIYVSLPAVALIYAPKIHFDSNTFSIVLISWLLLALSALFVIWLTKDMPQQIRASMLLIVPLGNTSFLAIPLIKALAGEGSMPYILIYDQFGTFLALSTYGAFIIGYYEHGALDWKKIGKKIATFPPLIALVCALMIGEQSQVVQSYLKILAATLSPLAMVSVGYALRLSFGGDSILFAKAIGTKMLLMPLAAFFISKLFGLNDEALTTVTLEAGMPSMITAGILAIRHNFAPALASAMVGYGIIISLFLTPFIFYIIRMY